MVTKEYISLSKTFLKLEQFRFSLLQVLQSPFPTNIHETLVERLCVLFLHVFLESFSSSN